MLSELRAEDAGEVRFQAGPAQSLALLEVEGKHLGREPQRVHPLSPAMGLTDLGLAPRTLPLSLPLPPRGCPGSGHRGQRVSPGRGDFGSEVQGNGLVA